MSYRSVNKVLLVGRVQPENPKAMSADNRKGAKFTVATQEAFKNKNGEWEKPTDWHNVVAWGYLADKVMRLKKGDIVAVEGSLKVRKFRDQNGVDVKFVFVKAMSVAPIYISKSDTEDSSAGSEGAPKGETKPKEDSDELHYDDPFDDSWDNA